MYSDTMSPSPLRRERLIVIISVSTPHSNQNSRLQLNGKDAPLLYKAATLVGIAALALLPYAVPAVTVAVGAHGFYKFGKFHPRGCGAAEESRGAAAAGPSEENKAGQGEEN